MPNEIPSRRESRKPPELTCPQSDLKDHAIVRYSVLHGNEHLFATKYKHILPNEDELRAELLREQELIATQALASALDAPVTPAKPKRSAKPTGKYPDS